MAQILLQPVDSGWKKQAQLRKRGSIAEYYFPQGHGMALCQERAEFFWRFIRTAARGDWASEQWRAGAQRALTWLMLQRGPHLEVDGGALRCWTMFAHWVVSVWTLPSGEKSRTTLFITMLSYKKSIGVGRTGIYILTSGPQSTVALLHTSFWISQGNSVSRDNFWRVAKTPHG